MINSDSFLWESYQLKIKGKIDCCLRVIGQIRIGMLLLVIYRQKWKLLWLFAALRRGKNKTTLLLAGHGANSIQQYVYQLNPGPKISGDN